MTHYLTINRDAWERLADAGCEWTIPVDAEALASAKTILDPAGWLPWDRMRRVLCLAAGGGQQAILFAHLGYDVTLVDLSPAQLDRDRTTAQRLGLRMKFVEADMQDLTALDESDFDLVYQPVSGVYVPDIRKVYHQVARCVRPDGIYRVAQWNPIYTQMPETQEWDGEAYRIVHPQALQGKPIVQASRVVAGRQIPVTSLEFIHPLGDVIGGLGDAGFVIEHFSEPDSGDVNAPPASLAHLAAYVRPMFIMLARKRVAL